MKRYIDKVVNSINRKNHEEYGRNIYKEAPSRHGWLSAHKQDGYFVSEDWLIIGNVDDIERMANSLYENPKPSDVCKSISQTLAALDENRQAYRIQFSSLWYLYPGQFERERIEQKFVGDRKKIREVLSRSANSDGYVMDIEDKDDCRAVLKSLIGRSIARKFGSALLLYFNEDRRLRVKGGLFPQFNYVNQYLDKEDKK
jgi:hypothetical protein